jgi:2-polyprenyl-3-methyl-5-hydroxy-6-metoxy-1,4-benzoquinol methylase
MSHSVDMNPNPGSSEVRWIESEARQEQYRAHRGIKDDEEDDAMSDLFSDPDPLDTFSFRFELPPHENSTSDTPELVDITLSGHKAELGQTLHSTGLTLWQAAAPLCEVLVRAQSQQEKYSSIIRSATYFRGKDVLELVAGLGLCGILVHRMGAKRAILTDGDSDTLANLRANVRANSDEKSCRIDCRQLVFGESIENFVQQHGQFDIVIGADIIYTPDVLEPLWSSVTKLLKPRTGVFLLSYTRRNVSFDLVLENATKYGFVWEIPEESERVFVFSRSGTCDDSN